MQYRTRLVIGPTYHNEIGTKLAIYPSHNKMQHEHHLHNIGHPIFINSTSVSTASVLREHQLRLLHHSYLIHHSNNKRIMRIIRTKFSESSRFDGGLSLKPRAWSSLHYHCSDLSSIASISCARLAA